MSAWGAENQNWKIKIRVDGRTTYGYVVAGVKDTATDGNDLAWDVQAILDNLNTNASDPFIYVYFPHPEYTSPIVYTPAPEKGLYLSECLKAPLLPKDWIVEIDSNITGRLTITWPDLAATLPGHQVSLTDMGGAGTQTINMQEASSFSFENTAGVPRQFHLAIDEPSMPESESISSVPLVRTKSGRLAGYDFERGC